MTDQITNTGHLNTELPMSGSAGIESELKLLRDQVDLLQIATTERKKPWYKEISSIISVLAILFSGFTFVYSQVGEHAEEIRSKKEEMRGTLPSVSIIVGHFPPYSLV